MAWCLKGKGFGGKGKAAWADPYVDPWADPYAGAWADPYAWDPYGAAKGAKGKGKGKAAWGPYADPYAWDAFADPWAAPKGGGKAARKGGGKALEQDGFGGFPDPKSINVKAASKYELEDFLTKHQVQDHAGAKLRGLNPKLQAVVMQQGSMDDARDKTAVLMSRIKGFTKMKQGDWICPGCFDLQFAKNSECRKCGTAAPDEAQRVQMESGFDAAKSLDIAPVSDQEVEDFLEQFEFQQHAVDKLRALEPKLQAIVIGQGHMEDARDPTAVLMSRITGLQKITAGDWVCPGCMDLQFAKNQQCRKCQTPRP